MDSIGIDNIAISERLKTYFINNPKSKEWLNKFIANNTSKKSE